MTIKETEALRDVVAERRKQIEKGYTPEHDDKHSVSQILGYGGLRWYAPYDRAAMVRMAACILAGIERLDRAALAREEGTQ